MKILITIGLPAAIIFVFWFTWRYFKRKAPEKGSLEEMENYKKAFGEDIDK